MNRSLQRPIPVFHMRCFRYTHQVSLITEVMKGDHGRHRNEIILIIKGNVLSSIICGLSFLAFSFSRIWIMMIYVLLEIMCAHSVKVHHF